LQNSTLYKFATPKPIYRENLIQLTTTSMMQPPCAKFYTNLSTWGFESNCRRWRSLYNIVAGVICLYSEA